MRRLRPRLVPPLAQEEPRPRRHTVIRWVYLAAVAGLLAWLGNLFLGGFFYLRADGMVLGDEAVVAAEFPVTVQRILVHEGERVTADQVVATVSSQTVADTLARLIGEQADREIRLADLAIRNQTTDAIIGLAGTRESVASATRRTLEKLLADRDLPAITHSAAIDSEFRSKEDLARLQAQRSAFTAQISTLRTAVDQARSAIGDLRRDYDDGRLPAPIGGIVGRRIAQQGAVFGAGDPLLDIYGERRFVLAYVPTGGLFSVRIGEKVAIADGLHSFGGTITRVEPVAAALPREFQRAFTPVEHEQVIRVEFAAGREPPPLFAKVRVSGASLLPQW